MIKMLEDEQNYKQADSLIKEFKMDVNEFPITREKIAVRSIRYYMHSMSLDRVECLYEGYN